MAWWDDKAAALHERIIYRTLSDHDRDAYDEEQVRIAVVHTRQDIVLLASQLSSLNRQVWTVKWLLVAVVVVLAAIAYKIGAL